MIIELTNDNKNQNLNPDSRLIFFFFFFWCWTSLARRICSVFSIKETKILLLL